MGLAVIFNTRFSLVLLEFIKRPARYFTAQGKGTEDKQTAGNQDRQTAGNQANMGPIAHV